MSTEDLLFHLCSDKKIKIHSAEVCPDCSNDNKIIDCVFNYETQTITARNQNGTIVGSFNIFKMLADWYEAINKVEHLKLVLSKYVKLTGDEWWEHESGIYD